MKPLFLLALLCLAGCDGSRGTRAEPQWSRSRPLPGVNRTLWEIAHNGHEYLYVDARWPVLLHSESCACKGASLRTLGTATTPAKNAFDATVFGPVVGHDNERPQARKSPDGGLWVSVQRADGQGWKEVYVGPTQIVGDVTREAEAAVPATGGGYWAKVPGDSPWATEFELGFELGTLGASAEQAKAMIKQFRAGQTHDIKFWVQSKTGHYPK